MNQDAKQPKDYSPEDDLWFHEENSDHSPIACKTLVVLGILNLLVLLGLIAYF